MRKSSFLALALLISIPLVADEGMWLFNHPPRQLLKQRYGFEPAQAWLDHLQKASIRFNNGGSGSFVSANGLILTNTRGAFLGLLAGASVLAMCKAREHSRTFWLSVSTWPSRICDW